LNDPGSVTSIEIVRSHEGVFIETRYFPVCVENNLYKASNGSSAVVPAVTVIGLQKFGAVSRIQVSGRESIDTVISSHGFIVIAPLVVLWIVTFGIFGIVILSLSTETNTS
jgi:hypothetical protein